MQLTAIMVPSEATGKSYINGKQITWKLQTH